MNLANLVFLFNFENWVSPKYLFNPFMHDKVFGIKNEKRSKIGHE